MEYAPILKNISRYISLDDSELAFFTSLLEQKNIRRKTAVVKAAEVASHTYFVVKGCLRNYQIDKDGLVHIALFATEGWWVSDLKSFLTGAPATSFVDALEDSEVFQLSHENIERLYIRIPKFERFFRILHQNAYIALQDRVMERLSLTAEERYKNFRARYPTLEQRISQKQIAYYLGITPEFLSTLRARMTEH